MGISKPDKICNECKTIFSTDSCHCCGWPQVIMSLNPYDMGYHKGSTFQVDFPSSAWTQEVKEVWEMGYHDGLGDAGYLELAQEFVEGKFPVHKLEKIKMEQEDEGIYKMEDCPTCRGTGESMGYQCYDCDSSERE